MKSPRIKFCPNHATAQGGFTVPEFVVTVALVLIIAVGMVTAAMFGGRMIALASAKLDASDDMRGLLGDFTHDIRTAADVDVGQGTATSFTSVADNRRREGNAIQISLSSNTNTFIRYYVDTTAQTLNLMETGRSNALTLAVGVTNKLPFAIEDAWGNVATNDLPSEVISLLLQFSNPVFRNSANGLAENSQLSVRVISRTTYGYKN